MSLQTILYGRAGLLHFLLALHNYSSLSLYDGHIARKRSLSMPSVIGVLTHANEIQTIYSSCTVYFCTTFLVCENLLRFGFLIYLHIIFTNKRINYILINLNNNDIPNNNIINLDAKIEGAFKMKTEQLKNNT